MSTRLSYASYASLSVNFGNSNAIYANRPSINGHLASKCKKLQHKLLIRELFCFLFLFICYFVTMLFYKDKHETVELFRNPRKIRGLEREKLSYQWNGINTEKSDSLCYWNTFGCLGILRSLRSGPDIIRTVIPYPKWKFCVTRWIRNETGLNGIKRDNVQLIIFLWIINIYAFKCIFK